MESALIVLTGIGIFVFALSGALLAVRKEMDVVGMFVLASLTAVGGGLARDLLLDVPAAALRNLWWWLLIIAATVVVFFFHGAVHKVRRAVLVCDAVGLGMFCATSTTLALHEGLGPLESVLIGVMGGVAGGVLRDVLAGEIPSVLRRDTKLYVVPAVLGCAVVVGFDAAHVDGVWVVIAAAGAIIAVRILALWRGWTAPSPRAHG